MVCFGQVRLQEAEHREGHGSARQKLFDAWKPSCQTGCFDASAGLVFAEAEQFDAIAEEGGKTPFRVNPASVHLTEMDDDLSHRATLGTSKRVKVAKQFVVREMGDWLHKTLLTTTNFVLLDCTKSALGARNASRRHSLGNRLSLAPESAARPKVRHQGRVFAHAAPECRQEK